MKKFKDLKKGDQIAILHADGLSVSLATPVVDEVAYNPAIKDYIIRYGGDVILYVHGEDSSCNINPTINLYLYASPSLALGDLKAWYNRAHDLIAKEFDSKVDELTQKYNTVYEEIDRLERRG